MATVNQMIKRISAINVGVEAYKSVRETKEVIGDVQKEQMQKGFRQDGKKIGRYASKKYASAKFGQNSRAGLGFVDLKLTGAFYSGFITTVTPEAFKTFSLDDKNGKLTVKYNPFGLNEESKKDYSVKLRPVFITSIKRILGL